MAYLRGKHYLWTDTETWLHIWAADGYDAWEESGWACNDDGTRREGFEEASGTSLPIGIMDAFVMMRLAELIYAGLAEDAIERALGSDNSGCRVLRRNAETLRAALAQVKLEDPDPL